MSRNSHYIKNPLNTTDPSGYTFSHDQLEDAHQSGGTRVNTEYIQSFYNIQRDFDVGYEAMPGIYEYNYSTGDYTNSMGHRVSYQEVFNNYVVPNATFLPTNTNLSSIEFGTRNGESGVWFSTITWGPIKRMDSEDFIVSTEAQILSSFLSFGSGGGGVIYKEGSYSFSDFNLQCLAAEGKGLLGGWSRVRGSANVYRGKDGIYYANVSAVGFTPSSTQGSVMFSGNVEVYSGGSLVGTQTLNRLGGASIIQSGWQNVGQGTIALPSYGSDVYLRFNVGYTYSEGTGYVSPWPAQGHSNLYIPHFVIDAWTY